MPQNWLLVERITVEAGRATGVVLADGTQTRSRIVVSNADPKHIFLKLLDPELLDPAFRQRIKHLKTNAAYLKFHAALSDLPDFRTFFNGDFDPRYLAEVKICPSSKYFTQSWEDVRRGLPARRPVMEVQIPSVYDKSMAPEGLYHVMSVWALYAPVHLRTGTWDERRERKSASS